MLGRMGDTQRTWYRSERPNCPDVIFFKTRSYPSELHILVTITTFVNENQDDNQWQFHYLINAPPSATSWKFQTFNEFLRHNHSHCLLSTEPTQVVSSRYHLPPYFHFLHRTGIGALWFCQCWAIFNSEWKVWIYWWTGQLFEKLSFRIWSWLQWSLWKGMGCIDQSSLSEELPTLSSFHLEDPCSGKETSERQSFRKVLIFCQNANF